MNSLSIETTPRAIAVRCTADELVVSLDDGRVLSVPLAWFPRWAHARAEQLATLELLGDGEGIHWPDIDEDVSVIGLIAGKPSGEFRTASSH